MQTDLVTRRLLAAGHEVSIASNYGLNEGIVQWPTESGNIRVFPQSGGKFSNDILPMHAQQVNAEVVMSHYDAWVYNPEQLAGRWVPWYPMDCESFPERVKDKVKHALMRITQTHHSVEEAGKVGLDSEYVPAGFNGSVYYPRDRNAWKEQQGLQGRYVVGVVAANRGDQGAPSRKSYPQIFEAFKLFLEKEPDAILYVHAHTESSAGAHTDLEYLANQHGFADKVRKAHPYYLHCGLYSPEDMAIMYSGMDVLLNPSMGEGFGVPIVEAQACGTPVIVGDWTAMSEVGKSGARISKSDAFKYPVVGYGDMWLPQPGAICEALVESLGWPDAHTEVSERVQEYEINHVWEQNWLPALQKLEHKVKQLELPKGNRKARRADGKTTSKKMPKVKLEKRTSGNQMRALLTFATGPHEELLEIALPSYTAFAEQHGYDLLVGTLAEPCDRPPSWWKIPMLRKALSQYYEVLFLGADLVITDTSEDMLVPATAWQALVPHRNHNGEIPNCDVWLVRKPMIPLLSQAWQMAEYTEHGWWEQAAILDLMGYEVGPIPNRRAYSSDVYDKTHFLDDEWNVHRWCEQPQHPRIMHATMYEDRAATMRAWAEQAALCAA